MVRSYTITSPISRHKRAAFRRRKQYFDGRVNRSPMYFMSSNDMYMDFLRQEEKREQELELRVARSIDRSNMSREDLAMEQVEQELEELYGAESECERNQRLEDDYLAEVQAKGWASL